MLMSAAPHLRGRRGHQAAQCQRSNSEPLDLDRDMRQSEPRLDKCTQELMGVIGRDNDIAVDGHQAGHDVDLLAEGDRLDMLDRSTKTWWERMQSGVRDGDEEGNGFMMQSLRPKETHVWHRVQVASGVPGMLEGIGRSLQVLERSLRRGLSAYALAGTVPPSISPTFHYKAIVGLTAFLMPPGVPGAQRYHSSRASHPDECEEQDAPILDLLCPHNLRYNSLDRVPSWVLVASIQGWRLKSSTTTLAGLSSLGGLWSTLNGVFALLFGANILVFMNSSRSLSPLGVIHIFQRNTLLRNWHADYPALKAEGSKPPGAVAFMRDRMIDIPQPEEEDEHGHVGEKGGGDGGETSAPAPWV
ncbi:hypothetical protein FB45DRAFT_1004239 [Roridomyces roridus]|uniref:Uncharacterized protein n=1 Tax=Roridomyces roridus TaxID=1738132 RepID=A0AAD7BRM1_9AGAR|nr:hypothetical protein FB45DRAFT_1004239 [Roridomyces roridus]